MERNRSLVGWWLTTLLLGCGPDGKGAEGGTLGGDTESDTDTGVELIECAGVEFPAATVFDVGIENLDIENGEELAQLDGVRCIKADGFSIRGVTNLAALADLERMEGGIFVVENPGLINLDPLSALTYVGGNVVVDANPDLVDIDGLVSLVEVYGLKIGLPSGPVQDGSTPFHGNDSLFALPSFANLVVVEDIVIADNDSLTTLGAPPPAVGLEYVGFLNDPELPAASASAWVGMLAPSTSEVCGCLEDPQPTCEPQVPPP